MRKILLLLYLLALVKLTQAQSNIRTPMQAARAIVDRIISETTFELKDVEQRPVLEIQVIDFGKINSTNADKYIFAESRLSLEKDKEINFGISNDNPITIYIDGKKVFESKKTRPFQFAEVAYEIFEFQDKFSFKLSAGEHIIAIQSDKAKPAKVYLRELTEVGVVPYTKFFTPHSGIDSTWPWCYRSGKENHGECKWPPVQKLKHLAIPSSNTYRRESYCEWQYPNGSMLMSILDFSFSSGSKDYERFVRRCADFTNENYELFKNQYYDMNDLRGTNHKLFRKCMLDDSGSPTLFLQELALMCKTKNYDRLINEMAKYISSKQVRLKDQTFCRPEPQKYTVWADDLFMSVPFLLRMGAITKNKKYYDDAVAQIINMNKYLLDDEKQIYHHAWYDFKKEQSQVLWGRANGWIIWAEAEALKFLPKEHTAYSKIANILNKHLTALANYQSKNGLWHQVLDDSTSFEETSCSAMFLIGYIRAMELSKINLSYSNIVERAWKGLQSKISSDGIVYDICRGTGISDDINFYKSRERFPNDPRGLGAVISALNELTKFYSSIK